MKISQNHLTKVYNKMIFAFLLISKCIHKQSESYTAGLIGTVRYFNKNVPYRSVGLLLNIIPEM